MRENRVSSVMNSQKGEDEKDKRRETFHLYQAHIYLEFSSERYVEKSQTFTFFLFSSPSLINLLKSIIKIFLLRTKTEGERYFSKSPVECVDKMTAKRGSIPFSADAIFLTYLFFVLGAETCRVSSSPKRNFKSRESAVPPASKILTSSFDDKR